MDAVAAATGDGEDMGDAELSVLAETGHAPVWCAPAPTGAGTAPVEEEEEEEEEEEDGERTPQAAFRLVGEAGEAAGAVGGETVPHFSRKMMVMAADAPPAPPMWKMEDGEEDDDDDEDKEEEEEEEEEEEGGLQVAEGLTKQRAKGVVPAKSVYAAAIAQRAKELQGSRTPVAVVAGAQHERMLGSVFSGPIRVPLRSGSNSASKTGPLHPSAHVHHKQLPDGAEVLVPVATRLFPDALSSEPPATGDASSSINLKGNMIQHNHTPVSVRKRRAVAESAARASEHAHDLDRTPLQQFRVPDMVHRDEEPAHATEDNQEGDDDDHEDATPRAPTPVQRIQVTVRSSHDGPAVLVQDEQARAVNTSRTSAGSVTPPRKLTQPARTRPTSKLAVGPRTDATQLFTEVSPQTQRGRRSKAGGVRRVSKHHLHRRPTTPSPVRRRSTSAARSSGRVAAKATAAAAQPEAAVSIAASTLRGITTTTTTTTTATPSDASVLVGEEDAPMTDTEGGRVRRNRRRAAGADANLLDAAGPESPPLSAALQRRRAARLQRKPIVGRVSGRSPRRPAAIRQAPNTTSPIRRHPASRRPASAERTSRRLEPYANDPAPESDVGDESGTENQAASSASPSRRRRGQKADGSRVRHHRRRVSQDVRERQRLREAVNVFRRRSGRRWSRHDPVLQHQRMQDVATRQRHAQRRNQRGRRSHRRGARRHANTPGRHDSVHSHGDDGAGSATDEMADEEAHEVDGVQERSFVSAESATDTEDDYERQEEGETAAVSAAGATAKAGPGLIVDVEELLTARERYVAAARAKVAAREATRERQSVYTDERHASPVRYGTTRSVHGTLSPSQVLPPRPKNMDWLHARNMSPVTRARMECDKKLVDRKRHAAQRQRKRTVPEETGVSRLSQSLTSSSAQRLAISSHWR